MKTYKLIYKNPEKLQSFINDNNIKDSSKILIQIFSNADYNYINNIINNLSNLLPNSNILGVNQKAASEKITDETIVSFTIFNNINIKSFEIDDFNENHNKTFLTTIRNFINNETQLIVLLINTDIVIEPIIDTINQQHSNIIITGVRTSSSNSYIFSNDFSTTNGLIFVAFEYEQLFNFDSYDFNYYIHEQEQIMHSCYNTIIHTIDSVSAVNFYETYSNQIICQLFHKASESMYTVNKKLNKQVIDATNKLYQQYYIDSLTNLFNSNKFNETLESDNISSLALLDISSFVSINNFYGAKIGDSILIEFANMIKDFSSDLNYICYRIYSDIFAIVVTDNKEAKDVFVNNLSLLQEKIHTHCFSEHKYDIYINTTFALCNNNNSIYKLASMSLEYAKTKNKSFIVYDKELHIEKKIENNLLWVTKIIDAIESDRIIPFFQPILNNATGKYDKFEVLMRMLDVNGDIIPPNKFMRIAKKSKLYNQLTKIIIDKSFSTFENTDYDFSINISVEDIINEDTREYIFNKLETSSCSSHAIFELVESESIENYNEVAAFIDKIKSYGAKVAIDDFGTGFSNFHYLFKLNINCIKLDGSIIENIATDKACELVAKTIIGFAQKMNITTIAEYVSNKEIYDKIKQLGIDFSQGYYFSKPVDSIYNLTNTSYVD